MALWSTSVHCLESPWVISHTVLGLLSKGWTGCQGLRQAPPLPQLQRNLNISLCCLFRKDGLGLVEKSSLATITSHKSYSCVLKEVINIERDAILLFRITKCYWKLRFGQVTTFWICQTLCFANGVGFLEPLLVGSSAELAVTSQGLSNRMCSPNICSLNDLTLCLHFHDF